MNSKTEQLRGKFLTVEGVEGVGKSTNVEFIRSLLEAAGHEVIVTREPGGTATGERVRSILLDKDEQKMTALTELLLMFAARSQHISEVIEPALARGAWVVCDRFTDSSYAYQGGGRQLSAESIEQLETLVVDACRPDLVLILDLDVREGLARASRRSVADRFELEEQAFFDRVRRTFVERATRPGYQLIDASSSLAVVQRDIRQAVTELLQ